MQAAVVMLWLLTAACQGGRGGGASHVMWCPTLQEADGGYAKKWLVLNVVEAGGRKKEPLGRVVIDLAEFAGLEGQVSQSPGAGSCCRSLKIATCDRSSTHGQHCPLTAPDRAL